MPERIYHPLVQIARSKLWGDAGLIRSEDWDQWFQLSAEDKARYVGARTSCPVVETLSKHPDYGPIYLKKRYGNVNFWYRFLKDQMGEREKFKSFGEPVNILFWGGLGKYDPEWVPAKNKNVVKGPETYHAYVLPRQIIDIASLATEQSRLFPKYDKKVDFVARQVFTAIDSVLEAGSLDIAVLRLALQSKDLYQKEEKIRKRIFDPGYKEELPEKYWKPIFERMQTLLASKGL